MDNDTSKNIPKPESDTTTEPQRSLYQRMMDHERAAGWITLIALCAVIAVVVVMRTRPGQTAQPEPSPEDFLARGAELYQAGEYAQAVEAYWKYEAERASRPDLPDAHPDWLDRALAITQAIRQGRAVTPALAKATNGAKALHPFSSGLALIEADGEIKFVDAGGQIVTPRPGIAKPYAERRFRDGLLCVGIDNGGYVRRDGTRLEGFNVWQFTECYPFSDGLALVREKASGSYGYIGTDGTLVIDPVYDDAKPFREGRAFARRDGRWMVIDTAGKEYSSFASTTYDGAQAETVGMTDGVAIVGNDEGLPVMINLRGEEMHLRTNDRDDHPAAFSEGLRAFRGDDGAYGYETLSARVAIEPAFRSAYNFHDGVAIVGDGKRFFGLTDRRGRLVVPYRYDRLANSSDSLVVFGSRSAGGKMRYGVINHRGDTIHPCVYDSIAPFSEGFAAARKGYKLGYLDHFGLSTFDCQ